MLWYLNVLIHRLAIRLKLVIKQYLLIWENVATLYPVWQIYNTFKRLVKLTEDVLRFHVIGFNALKSLVLRTLQVFEKHLFKCVKQPDCRKAFFKCVLSVLAPRSGHMHTLRKDTKQSISKSINQSINQSINHSTSCQWYLLGMWRLMVPMLTQDHHAVSALSSCTGTRHDQRQLSKAYNQRKISKVCNQRQ